MEKGTQEMTWREETIADAHIRLNYLNKQIDEMAHERAEIYDVLNALGDKPGPGKVTVVGGVKFTTRKKPALKPRISFQPAPGERVEFVIYGRTHYLRKTVLETLLHLKTFCTPKVVAQVRKWHRIRSKSAAETLARYYIRYLKENDFIESYRKHKRVRYSVKKEKLDSLAALVEGL